MQLRLYQVNLSIKWLEILKKNKLIYLAMEVRTGKTITALEIAKLYWAKNILFITKIKAFSSIKSDHQYYSDDFNITVINKESVHKVEWEFDLVIVDEAHGFGTYPKPNKASKEVKKRFWKLPMIFLSGTPSPESYSQLFHQYWLSNNSPWKDYKNFYFWARDYIIPKTIYTSYWEAKDYSGAIEGKVMSDISHIMLTYTQEEAWFTTVIDEQILYMNIAKSTYELANNLITNRVIQGKTEVVLADTAVALQQKLHQIYSGTVKFESGNAMTFDRSKAEYIKERFSWKKIGIFYIYTQELRALEEVFGESLTTDLDEFNSSNKSIALQIVSWREWISLKNADSLIFYNISFSAVSYWQARDRLTTMDRKVNNVYWIFSKWWIEEKIYKAVMDKKSYTLDIFKKDFAYRV